MPANALPAKSGASASRVLSLAIMSLTFAVPDLVLVDERREAAVEANILVSLLMAALTFTMVANSSGEHVTLSGERSVDAGRGGRRRSLGLGLTLTLTLT